jgi:hypothetical protein
MWKTGRCLWLMALRFCAVARLIRAFYAHDKVGAAQKYKSPVGDVDLIRLGQ